MNSNFFGEHILVATEQASGMIDDHLEIFPYSKINNAYGICLRSNFGGGSLAISSREVLVGDGQEGLIAKLKEGIKRGFDGSIVSMSALRHDHALTYARLVAYTQKLPILEREDSNVIGYANPLRVVWHPAGWIPTFDSTFSKK